MSFIRKNLSLAGYMVRKRLCFWIAGRL